MFKTEDSMLLNREMVMKKSLKKKLSIFITAPTSDILVVLKMSKSFHYCDS
jgi:hypothetical protein